VSVFLPLFLGHGALLHLFWCRVHLRRADRIGAGLAHDGHGTEMQRVSAPA
jgi:hypothetical protein